jgi:hypothetical protein
MVEEAREILPKLSVTERSRGYYRKLLELVKMQSQLHKVYTGDSFRRFIYQAGQQDSAPQVPMADTQVNAALVNIGARPMSR